MTEQGGVNWSDTEWNRVRKTVHDEAMRGRIAASFLPLFGPLPDDTETVPRNRLVEAEGGVPVLRVDDYETIRLCTVSVNVELRNAQAADPELQSALMMFRRAADIVARVEDALIFNGQPAAGEGPATAPAGLPAIYRVSGGGCNPGLLESAATEVKVGRKGAAVTGPQVFEAVVEGVTKLERAGHYGPFALVLGDRMFQAVNTPIPQSMVLPRDSILPYLNGPLLRSSVIDEAAGVMISLTGEPVEIVVPKDISVRYLQTTMDARHVFRVSQRFVLRVKDASAIVRMIG